MSVNTASSSAFGCFFARSDKEVFFLFFLSVSYFPLLKKVGVFLLHLIATVNTTPVKSLLLIHLFVFFLMNKQAWTPTGRGARMR